MSYIFVTLADAYTTREMIVLSCSLDREVVVPSEFLHCLCTGKLMEK